MKTKNYLSRVITGLGFMACLIITNYSSAQQLNIDTSQTQIDWSDYDFAGPHSKLVSEGWWKWWYLPAAAIPITGGVLLSQGEDEVVTPPTINCLPDQTLLWNEELPPPNVASISATNNCPDGELTIQHVNDVSNGGRGCVGDPLVIVRTYRATDDCGNQNTCKQTFTYTIDDQAPILNCPSDMTLQWGEEVPAPDVNSLTTSDNCTPTGEIILTHLNDEDNGGNGCVGTPRIIQRTYQAEDACGNLSSCIQTFTFAIDDQAPILNCPVDITLSWGEEVPAPDLGSLTVSDNCTPTGEIILTHLNDEDNGGNGCVDNPRIIQRTYQAEDACGNQSSCTQTFTFAIDDQGPILNCPIDMTLQWGEEVPAPDLGSLTVSDNCTPTGEIILTHLNDEDNGGNGCAGNPRIVQRTYQAEDACGNQSSCTQTFTFAIDDQAPILNCPVDMTLQWGEEVPTPDLGSLTVSDNCTPTGEIILTHLNDDDNGGNGCLGSPRIIQRTYQAEDACGNQSTCIQAFTFSIDEEAPTLSCPADITLECSESYDPSITGSAIAVDNCTPESEIVIDSQDDLSGLTECNGTGTIIRTWTATDNCGNVSTCSQRIVLEDTTAPIFTDTPIDITVDCMDIPPPFVLDAEDNCMEGSPTITFEENIGLGCPFDITRTWVATDACGNESTYIQTITVEDNTAPEIACPVDVIVICGESIDPSITGTPLIIDCTDFNISFTDDFSNQTGCTGFIIRNFTVVDECGNASFCEQQINIVDTGCDFMPDITITDADCAIPDGEIIIDPILDFTYNWSNGQSGPSISNLTAGTYTVTIVNADLSCSQILPLIVPEAPPYPLVLLDANDPSPGASNGSIEIMIPGPNIFPPYTILLNGSNYGTTSSTTFTISNLSQGTYSIQVIDSNGCLSEILTVILMDVTEFGGSWPGEVWIVDLNSPGISQTDWNELHNNAYDLDRALRDLSSKIEHPPLENSYEINYKPEFSYMLSGGKYLNPNVLLRFGIERYSGKASVRLNEEIANPFYLDSHFQGLQVIGGIRNYFGHQKFRLFVGGDVSWKRLSIKNSLFTLDQTNIKVADATDDHDLDLNLVSGFQLPIGSDLGLEFEFRPGFEVDSKFQDRNYSSNNNNYRLNLKYRF